jgi:hypothetical protein
LIARSAARRYCSWYLARSRSSTRPSCPRAVSEGGPALGDRDPPDAVLPPEAQQRVLHPLRVHGPAERGPLPRVGGDDPGAERPDPRAVGHLGRVVVVQPDQVERDRDSLQQWFSGFRLRVEDVAAELGTPACRGVNNAPIMGLPPTGKPMEIDVIDIGPLSGRQDRRALGRARPARDDAPAGARAGAGASSLQMKPGRRGWLWPPYGAGARSIDTRCTELRRSDGHYSGLVGLCHPHVDAGARPCTVARGGCRSGVDLAASRHRLAAADALDGRGAPWAVALDGRVSLDDLMAAPAFDQRDLQPLTGARGRGSKNSVVASPREYRKRPAPARRSHFHAQSGQYWPALRHPIQGRVTLSVTLSRDGSAPARPMPRADVAVMSRIP